MMRGKIPQRPYGSSAAWIFFQRVWDKLWGAEAQFLDSPTVKVNQTSKGIYFTASAGSSGGGIFQAQITVEHDDYVECTMISTTAGIEVEIMGGTEYAINDLEGNPIPTGATINVAKPFLLRRSSYDGLTLPPNPVGAHPPLANFVAIGHRTLTYTDGMSNVVDTQLIDPPYTVGALIYVSRPVGGTGVMAMGGASAPVTFQDENNDGRKWKTEVPACDSNGVAGFRLADASQWYPNQIG